MEHKTSHKILVKIIPFLVVWLLRLWFSSCRRIEHNPEFWRECGDLGKGTIAAFWHYSIGYVFFHLRKFPAAVLVSASKDGDYIASLATNLNFSTVRGSRNRRGLRALKELMECLKRGENVGIVADGSQGPALVVQAGAILLASKTGSPILPIIWSASRCITFNSWDRLAIPKPFSRIDFYYGEPLFVPPGADSDVIEEYRLILEGRLVTLYRKAWESYGKEKHW